MLWVAAMITIGRNARFSTGIASTAAVDSAKPSIRAGYSSTSPISSGHGRDNRSHSRANLRTSRLPTPIRSAAWCSPRTYHGDCRRSAAASRSASVSPGRSTRPESNASTTTPCGALDQQPADSGYPVEEHADRRDGDRDEDRLLDGAPDVSAQRLFERLGDH